MSLRVATLLLTISILGIGRDASGQVVNTYRPLRCLSPDTTLLDPAGRSNTDRRISRNCGFEADSWQVGLLYRLLKTQADLQRSSALSVQKADLDTMFTAVNDAIAQRTVVAATPSLLSALQQVRSLSTAPAPLPPLSPSDRDNLLAAIAGAWEELAILGVPPEWVPDATAKYAGTTPKVGATVTKYYFWPSDRFALPLVVMSSLPTIADTTLKSIVNNLLDEYGGVLHGSAYWSGKPLRSHDPFPADSTTLGVWLEVRAGGKLVETGGEVGTLKNTTGFATGLATLRFVFPVTQHKTSAYDVNRAGLVTLTLTSSTNLAANTAYLSNFNGALSPKWLTFENFHLAAYITNVLYLNTGLTLATSNSTIKHSAYFSLSTNRESSR